MRLKRKVEQGFGKADPRLRTYFVYSCALCGQEKDFEWQPLFDATRLRKCPNCGVTNDSSNEELLIRRKHELEQQIKQATEELSKVSSELSAIQGDLSKLKAMVTEGL